MKKGIGTPENRELAFRVYAFFGGRNIPRVLRRLFSEHDIDISARTLHDWKNEGNWDERIRTAVRGELPGTDMLTFDEKMLKRIIGIVGRYESQIKTGASLDNQAAYAYTNLVKTAIELARNMKRWEKKEHDRPGSDGDKANDPDNDNARTVEAHLVV